MGYHYCRSWSSRNDSRDLPAEKKNKKYFCLIKPKPDGKKDSSHWKWQSVISQTLHKSQEYYRSDCPEKSTESIVCVWTKRGNGVVSESWNLYKR